MLLMPYHAFHQFPQGKLEECPTNTKVTVNAGFLTKGKFARESFSPACSVFGATDFIDKPFLRGRKPEGQRSRFLEKDLRSCGVLLTHKVQLKVAPITLSPKVLVVNSLKGFAKICA